MGLLAIILLAASFIVYLSSQSDRVKHLEKELSELRKKLDKLSPGSANAEEQPEEPREAAAEPGVQARSAPEFIPPQPSAEAPVEASAAPVPEPVAATGISQLVADKKDTGPAIDWERFTGIKLFSWIGGFALFLGAAFFVKYSIDHGLLSPMVRVMLSFILGGASIGTGLYLKNSRFMVTAYTLCAAGVAILYADIFAASSRSLSN